MTRCGTLQDVPAQHQNVWIFSLSESRSPAIRKRARNRHQDTFVEILDDSDYMLTLVWNVFAVCIKTGADRLIGR